MLRSGILISAAAIILLYLLRIVITGNLRYDFIVWNIFLASVPLLIARVFPVIQHHLTGWIAKISSLAAAGLWLLFLPNAFYIITDFMHLNSSVVVNARHDTKTYSLFYERGSGLYVYDTLILFAATAFGAYVGGLALYHAYNYFKKRTSPLLTNTAIVLIMLLSAAGVYIGRFGRWNSWEGVTHPYDIVADLFGYLISTETRGRFIILVLTVVIFQVISLVFVCRQKSHDK